MRKAFYRAAGKAKNWVAATFSMRTNAVRSLTSAEDDRALREAARNGYATLYDLLLLVEARDADASTRYNMVFQETGFNSHVALVQHLLNTEELRQALHSKKAKAVRWDAYSRQIAIIPKLLEIQEVREHAHAQNNELLRWAAENGHVDVVRKLLAIPAVRNQAHALDNEALRLSAQNNHTMIVALLLAIQEVREPAEALCNHPLLGVHVPLLLKTILQEQVKENNDSSNSLENVASSSNVQFSLSVTKDPTPLQSVDKDKTAFYRKTY